MVLKTWGPTRITGLAQLQLYFFLSVSCQVLWLHAASTIIGSMGDTAKTQDSNPASKQLCKPEYI